MRRTTWRWLGAVAFVLLLPQSLMAGETEKIAVIVHKGDVTKGATRSDLRPIFQTRTEAWSDGSPARPFNLPVASATRRGFDAAVLGLDPDRVTRYWIDRKIRGGARPPREVPSEALMLKLISRTPGAVGYVTASMADASVTVVAHIINGEVVSP